MCVCRCVDAYMYVHLCVCVCVCMCVCVCVLEAAVRWMQSVSKLDLCMIHLVDESPQQHGHNQPCLPVHPPTYTHTHTHCTYLVIWVPVLFPTVHVCAVFVFSNICYSCAGV